jgi:putative endonuclease
MYFVYLLASKPYGTLYVGVTSNLAKRLAEHKAKLVRGFTAEYGVGSTGLVRVPRRACIGAAAREADQGMETRLENQSDRVR